MQARSQPVDVVVDDAGGRFLAAVVEDDEHRELAPAPHPVLGRLAQVAGAVIDGDGGAAGHLELGDDVVVEKVVETSGHGIAPGQAALQF